MIKKLLSKIRNIIPTIISYFFSNFYIIKTMGKINEIIIHYLDYLLIQGNNEEIVIINQIYIRIILKNILKYELLKVINKNQELINKYDEYNIQIVSSISFESELIGIHEKNFLSQTDIRSKRIINLKLNNFIEETIINMDEKIEKYKIHYIKSIHFTII